MNFTNLYYFQTVAEEMNFTRAAKRLYISQQSLSGHIARLEEECGTQLFERSPKLRLTYAGECVLEYAGKILACEKQMNDCLADIVNNRRGKLSLGVYLHRSQVFLSKTFPEFLRLYPHTKLHLETGLSKTLEERLLQGALDLIVGFTPFQNKDLDICHLVTERLCLMVPKEMFDTHFINSRTVSGHFSEHGADLRAFADFPFLYLEPDNRARVLADLLFQKQQIEPRVLVQTADSQTMLSLCQGGIGCAFVFEEAARDFLARYANTPSNVYTFPIMDEIAVTELVIAYQKNRYLNLTARNFIRLAHNAFQPKP